MTEKIKKRNDRCGHFSFLLSEQDYASYNELQKMDELILDQVQYSDIGFQMIHKGVDDHISNEDEEHKCHVGKQRPHC